MTRAVASLIRGWQHSEERITRIERVTGACGRHPLGGGAGDCPRNRLIRVVLRPGSRDDYAQKKALAVEQIAGLTVADVRTKLDWGHRAKDARLVIRRAIASLVAQRGLSDATVFVDWE